MKVSLACLTSLLLSALGIFKPGLRPFLVLTDILLTELKLGELGWRFQLVVTGCWLRSFAKVPGCVVCCHGLPCYCMGGGGSRHTLCHLLLLGPFCALTLGCRCGLESAGSKVICFVAVHLVSGQGWSWGGEDWRREEEKGEQGCWVGPSWKGTEETGSSCAFAPLGLRPH